MLMTFLLHARHYYGKLESNTCVLCWLQIYNLERTAKKKPRKTEKEFKEELVNSLFGGRDKHENKEINEKAGNVRKCEDAMVKSMKKYDEDAMVKSMENIVKQQKKDGSNRKQARSQTAKIQRVHQVCGYDKKIGDQQINHKSENWFV